MKEPSNVSVIFQVLFLVGKYSKISLDNPVTAKVQEVPGRGTQPPK
jgi:hypothetical protein